MSHPNRRSTSQRRLDRLPELTVRTGLLSVADQSALAAVGFEPVTEVIGALAKQVRPTGFYSAGNYWQNVRGITYTSSNASVAVGTPLRITELKSGYRTVFGRVRDEARAAGADGVIGLQLSLTRESGAGGTELWKFLAIGTAVRSIGHRRAPAPFTTDLTGARTAAAIQAGWMPLSLIVCPVLAIRLIDAWSQFDRRRTSPAAEIAAYTDVVNICRHQARNDFAAEARRAGADGAVLTGMDLDFEPKRDEGHCEAMVTMTGTALGQFRVAAPARASLAILPLSNKGEQR